MHLFHSVYWKRNLGLFLENRARHLHDTYDNQSLTQFLLLIGRFPYYNMGMIWYDFPCFSFGNDPNNTISARAL